MKRRRVCTGVAIARTIGRMFPTGDDPIAARFPPTRHSALEALRSSDESERRRGLDAIAAAYWRPVYAYLRLRWRRSHEEASDLTQELFAAIVDRDLLARFDPSRARLRTYLRACADGIAGNQHRAARRRGRGGEGGLTFRFDEVREEVERLLGSAQSPEETFEQEWARGLLSTAIARVLERCRREGKEEQFRLFEQYDLCEGTRPTYAELAQRFAIAPTDVTNRLARVRRLVREAALGLLRESSATEAEYRAEARALLGVDGR
jgi:RNA polymerase sigma factor (sigma-70 family)